MKHFETFIESIRDELAERTRLTHLKHLDICVSQLHVLAGASAVALAADSSHLDTPEYFERSTTLEASSLATLRPCFLYMT